MHESWHYHKKDYSCSLHFFGWLLKRLELHSEPGVNDILSMCRGGRGKSCHSSKCERHEEDW